ncbi:recombinase family protein [Chloroflexota bacterium]
MRAVGYIRVSDASQVEGHSLGAQERLFNELCKSRVWQAIKTYREEGKSAHVDAISKRPAFHQLLDDASKHQFDVVVVHSLDRWARNLKVSLEALTILSNHNVGLISISEQLDWSTPQGRLSANMLGSMAQFYSEMLGIHVKKGLDQRAREGKHTGGIPFGYESCWIRGKNDEKTLRCNPEHSAGIHIYSTEGPTVTELFHRYASGSATLSQLALWVNEQGLRTRNMHKLPGPDGILSAEPRLFTTASIRVILHNPFYTGKVKYNDELFPGTHEPLVSQEIFDIVQITLKKNSGRSETLSPRPAREYLLKGLVRCAYCGMPMWAQTYYNGRRYYREHKASRGHGVCSAASGSIPCHVADSQVIHLVENIELGDRWLEEVLTIISVKDEAERINKKKQDIQQRLRRMAKTYIDGLLDDTEYSRQKRMLELELESLVIPEIHSAEQAGKLLQNFPTLWALANLEEQRKLLVSMLDAVYIDTKNNLIIAVKPKPPFKPVFQVAASREGSDIRILNEPLEGSSLFLVETGESRTPRHILIYPQVTSPKCFPSC